MFTYKVDILLELKKAGYSSYRLRVEKILNQSSIQKLRDGEIVCVKILDKLCSLLNCQPGDLIEHKKI